ncbi:MAG: hypothetical protein AAFV53_34930 [Myxococcota bacterium]
MPNGYAHLNLRWNPFSEPLPEDRLALVVGDVSSMASTLSTGRVCIQLMGDHGRGKTSRLLALKRTLGAPYVRLRDSHHIPAAPVVLLDEGELLWRRPWWRLRRCGAAAVSTHRDLSVMMRALGFSVVTRSVRGLSLDGLVAMVDHRLRWAQREEGPVPGVPLRTLRALLATYGDDVRTIEDVLYDRFAQLEEIGDVEV